MVQCETFERVLSRGLVMFYVFSPFQWVQKSVHGYTDKLDLPDPFEKSKARESFQKSSPLVQIVSQCWWESFRSQIFQNSVENTASARQSLNVFRFLQPMLVDQKKKAIRHVRQMMKSPLLRKKTHPWRRQKV